MEMFLKHSANLVYGLGHPPVLRDDPVPGTGILLLWLFRSLVASLSWKTACWTVDFDIGALHHELNLCLDRLERVLLDCLLL